MPLTPRIYDLPSDASRDPSPEPPIIFDESDAPGSPRSRASTPQKLEFEDLPLAARRKVWEYMIQPRMVELYPSRLGMTKLELWKEILCNRPEELPKYTLENLAPVVRERCHTLQKSFSEGICEPERLKEVQGLYKMVNMGILFLTTEADRNPKYLFDLRTIIHMFLRARIPLDYVPALLGWTELEMVHFIKLAVPPDQQDMDLFQWKYGGDKISDTQHQQLNQKVWRLTAACPTPTVLLINRESCDVGLQHYRRAFKPWQNAPGIWFAFQKDTLDLKPDDINEAHYPDWVYEQAWSQAYGHFEQTLRACHDYQSLSMLLENVSVLLYPPLRTLHHGYNNSLCLGKVHEMFMGLKNYSLQCHHDTETCDDLRKGNRDCEQAWKRYNQHTPTRWQFTRKPHFTIKSSVIDKGTYGSFTAVLARWEESRNPGIFRRFKVYEDIAVARIRTHYGKVALKTKAQAKREAEECFKGTKWAKRKAKECLSNSEFSSEASSCDIPAVTNSEIASTPTLPTRLPDGGVLSGVSNSIPPITVEAASTPSTLRTRLPDGRVKKSASGALDANVSNPSMTAELSDEQPMEEGLSNSGSDFGTSSSDVVMAESVSTQTTFSDTFCNLKQEKQKAEELPNTGAGFMATLPFRPRSVVVGTERVSRAHGVSKTGSHCPSARSRSCSTPKIVLRTTRPRACRRSSTGDVDMTF